MAWMIWRSSPGRPSVRGERGRQGSGAAQRRGEGRVVAERVLERDRSGGKEAAWGWREEGDGEQGGTEFHCVCFDVFLNFFPVATHGHSASKKEKRLR